MIRGAIKREPGAWQPWLVLAGLDAKQGHNAAALRDYRRARDLNPTSSLFEAAN
jgi:Tfp pilus assembly protein PilF